MKIRIELSCPRCGSKDVRSARNTGVLAFLMRPFFVVPYRCRSCRERFFRSGDPIALHSEHRLRRFGFLTKAASAK